MKMKGLWAACVIVALGAAGAQAKTEERHEDHQQLRAMLKDVTAAFNARNLKAMAPYLHEKFSITLPDQVMFSDLSELQKHLDGFFEGENGPLKTMVVEPTENRGTTFVDENTAISHVQSKDTFTLKNGLVRVFDSSWSATVHKRKGKWKLISLHSGYNILNNPMVTEARAIAKKRVLQVGALTFAAGLILGLAVLRVRGPAKA